MFITTVASTRQFNLRTELVMKMNSFTVVSALLLGVVSPKAMYSNAASVQEHFQEQPSYLHQILRRSKNDDRLAHLVGRLVLQCDMADDVHPSASNSKTLYLEPLNQQERDEVIQNKGQQNDINLVESRVYIDHVPAGVPASSVVEVIVSIEDIHSRDRRDDLARQVVAVSNVSIIALPAAQATAQRSRRQTDNENTHEIVFFQVTVEVVGDTAARIVPESNISHWRSYYDDVTFGRVKIPTIANVIPLTTTVTSGQKSSSSYCNDQHINDAFHMKQWLKMSTTKLRSDEYCSSARTIFYYDIVSTPEACAFSCLEYEKDCKFFRYNPSNGFCLGYRRNGFDYQSDCTKWATSSGNDFYRINFGSDPQISLSQFNSWYHSNDGLAKVLVYILPNSGDVTGSSSNDCDLCGRAAVGLNPAPMFLDGDVSSSCIFHELGHTLGANHAKSVFDNDQHPNFEGTRSSSTWRTKDGQGWTDTYYGAYSNFYEYGDRSSVMGTGTHRDGVGFSAPMVGLLGWLDDDEWEKNWEYPEETDSQCSQRFVLGALNRPRSRGDKFCPTKMITFLRGRYGLEDTHYHLSYRSTDQSTRDARLASPFGDAVFVHFTIGDLKTAAAVDGSFLVGVVGTDNEFRSTSATPGPNFRISMIGDPPSCYAKATGTAGSSRNVNRNEVVVEVDFCPESTWPTASSTSTKYKYTTLASGRYCSGSWYSFDVDGSTPEERAEQCAEITWNRRENSCTAGATDEFYGVFAVVEVGDDHQCRVYLKTSGGGNSCKSCQTIVHSGGQAFAYALDTSVCFDGNYPQQESDPSPFSSGDGNCLVDGFFEEGERCPQEEGTCSRKRARRDL